MHVRVPAPPRCRPASARCHAAEAVDLFRKFSAIPSFTSRATFTPNRVAPCSGTAAAPAQKLQVDPHRVEIGKARGRGMARHDGPTVGILPLR